MTTTANTTVETKVETKKFNLRDVAKRTDLFNVDPRIINVDWDSNPREDYGSEDFQELKESIRNGGVEMPLLVYIDKKDNSLQLAHGFRRMKAITELIQEGIEDLVSVPIKRIENNLETILSYHLSLNNGKPLSDLEIAKTLVQMFKLMGEDYTLVAKKANMDKQKVYKLINFVQSASTLNMEMVAKKEISLANAMAVAKQANGTTEQNQILEKAKESAKKNGHSKVKPVDLKGVETQNTRKRDDVVGAIGGFVQYLKSSGVQALQMFELEDMINALNTGAGLDELIDNFMTQK